MTDVSPLPGIRIVELDTVALIHDAADVLAAVWPGDRDAMPAHLLRALAHSGNYVVGMYDGEQMVGASAAFFGPPASRSMHSHITGVLPGRQGRGLGRALKQHQRAWALERGVGHITWTFDPLIARNAHFNLRVLGARATDYLVDQYGPMDDDVNRGDASDRLMVSWALAAPPVPTPDARAVRSRIPIPADIAAVRRDTPTAARAWRTHLRTALQDAAREGLRIGGFDDAAGYLLVDAD